MTPRDLVATAWSNLGRRRVRTVFTSTGVVVGVTTVVTMVSLVYGVQRQVTREFEKVGLDRLTVRPKSANLDMGGQHGGAFSSLFGLEVREKPIGPEQVKAWSQMPGVKAVYPQIEMPYGIVSALRVEGTTVPARISGGQSWMAGPFMAKPGVVAGEEQAEKPGQVVISQGTLRGKMWSRERKVTLLGTRVEVVLRQPRGAEQVFPCTVTGISSERAPLLKLSGADRLRMKEWWLGEKDLLARDGYDSVVLRAVDVSRAHELVPVIRKQGFQVQSIDALLETANKIFSVVTAMLAMVSSVALLVACIGIANTMVMSIFERTREIGTLKAMGASAADIRRMFMLEAGFIGLMGGVAGVACSWALGRALNAAAHWMAQRRQLPLPDQLFILTPALIGEALLLAFVIGVAAGVYPAQRAARLDPLKALRHE